MNKRIFVDIDGTLNNQSEVLLRRMNEKYGTNYNFEDIDSYNFFDLHYPNVWEETNRKDFWDEVGIDMNTIGIITRLVEEGNEVFLVSASLFHDTLSYKISKTLSHFSRSIMDESKVIITSRKYLVSGGILIDDYIANIVQYPGPTILYDQPWNREYEGHNRAHNFYEVYDMISKM